ncbi:brct domain-containing protein [Neofusicoccum parvum]|uniref:Brct domain-containing protein n=1 Tax=Neofusicoccum parvum TaxID=310453 RepID=A0ACB5SAT4_9PEZI|nr:brct domain-containing protein [Neofusicoccum parvum]
MGNPVTTIEPLGKPALVKMEDGSTVYGAYNEYVYAGAHGFKKMTGSALPHVLQMTKKAKPWYDGKRKTKGLSKESHVPETADAATASTGSPRH